MCSDADLVCVVAVWVGELGGAPAAYGEGGQQQEPGHRGRGEQQ